MLRTFRTTVLAALALLLAGNPLMGCGGDECTKHADCQKDDDKKNYICKFDTTTGTRRCEEKKTTPPKCPSTCDTDTDCADCEDNKTHCKNRVCVQPPKQCADSCTDDSDCKDCDDGKTSCLQGKCEKKAVCPDSCTQDDECKDCADGNNSCVSGTCGKADTCPDSCSSDDDCKSCDSARQTCSNGTCGETKPCKSSCTTSDDCAGCGAGNTFCNNGTCDQPPTTCPSSCKADVDCTPCDFGLKYCVSGQCSRDKPNTCPASCTTADDCKDCTDGRTSCTSGLCQKPICPSSCSTSDDCKNCPNRTSCLNGKCAGSSCPSSCGSDAECTGGCGDKTGCIAGQCENPKTYCGNCGTDSDCARTACGTKTKCIAGQCSDGNACPSFCTTDSHCAVPGCGSKTTCYNNKCLDNTCPSSCTSGQDCLAPACGNKTSCVNGACSAPPTCPSSCTSNADCAVSACGTRNSCRAGTCQAAGTCPPLCLSPAECAPCGANYTCRLIGIFGTCVPGSSGCPSSCTTTSQCAPCGSGYTCSGGRCQRGGSSSPAGRACSTTSTCPSGYRCITINQGSSYCFQDCTTRSGACASNTADGRTQCIAFATDSQGASVSVCLGEAAKGAACAFNTNKQAICQRNQKPRLYCSQAGTCKEVVVQTKAGDACTKSGSTTEPIRECDNTKGLVCDDTTSKCVVATLAKEGENCDSSGQNLGKQVICDTKAHKDILCVRFNSAGTIQACHVVCDPKKSGQCTHKTGLTCMSAFSDGRGLCMDLTCSKDSDCLFTDYTCEPLQAGGNACFPIAPPGPKKYGDYCGSPISTLGCQKGLNCLQLQNAQRGICTRECTSTCSTIQGKTAVCVNTSTTTKQCLVRCVSNTNCPTGSTCTSVSLPGGGSGSFCFPN